VLEAWRLPIEKIAISRWLRRELEAHGQEAEVVPNGVDHDLFFIEGAPELRPGPTVAFPAHALTWKALRGRCGARETQGGHSHGDRRGIRSGAAPTAAVVNLSVNPRPSQLRALYNRAQVFLAPSFSEGWDLPPCEAMACGAALVASAIPVREEYAEDGRNALLVPPGDAGAAAQAIRRLLDDDALRHQLARAGQARVSGLTWERSAALFEDVLSRPAA